MNVFADSPYPELMALRAWLLDAAALVCSEYTDDGCSIWRCSKCDFQVEMRGGGVHWRYCPSCKREFMFSKAANTQAAHEARYRRELLRHMPDHPATFYTFRAMVPNWARSTYCGDQGVCWHYFERKWSETAREYVRGALNPDWHFDLGDDPEPFREYREGFEGNERRLDRKRLVMLVKKFRGCPMWIGINREDTAKRRDRNMSEMKKIWRDE